jgi:hypothetical protein
VGAKTAILAYADKDAREVLQGRPTLDRAAALELVGWVFPGWRVDQVFNGSLEDGYPAEGVTNVGCFPGLELICDRRLMVERPSQLDRHLVRASAGRRLYLHAMHSVVDWLAFGVWEDTRLVRSLSVWPDGGLVENIGAPLAFEVPFWAGEHAEEALADEPPYPLPFGPLDLGEEALRSFFGFVYEGEPQAGDIEPSEIALVGVRLSPPLRSRVRQGGLRPA